MGEGGEMNLAEKYLVLNFYNQNNFLSSHMYWTEFNFSNDEHATHFSFLIKTPIYLTFLQTHLYRVDAKEKKRLQKA